MKATVSRPDGTVIEAEGTVEEIQALLSRFSVKNLAALIGPGVLTISPEPYELTWTSARHTD